MVQWGAGFKPAKLEKVLPKVNSALVAGETLLAVVRINSLRPMAAFALFTDARILFMDDANYAVKTDIALPNLSGHSISKGLGGATNLVLTLADGATSKWAILKKEDIPLFEDTLNSTSTAGVNNTVLETLATQRERGQFDAGRSLTKEERRADKSRRKEEAEVVRAEQERRDHERCGDLIEKQSVSLKTIAIFSKGYVRVGGFMGLGSAPYEKLFAIEDSTDIQKKTGLGRTLMAGATLGANLALTPNKRGDAYLTIVTEVRSHAIHVETPNAMQLKAIKSVAAAGRAVIAQHAGAPLPHDPTTDVSALDAPPATAQEPATLGPADKLREYASLHEQGLLTDDEYQSLRAKIIAGM